MFEDFIQNFYGWQQRSQGLYRQVNQLGHFNPILDRLLGYFEEGGSASEENRQKAVSQVLAPINRMIPDARTRRANQLAESGINPTGGQAIKIQRDDQVAADRARADAIGRVEQEFSERADRNKGIALNTTAQQIGQIRSVLPQILGQEGNLIGDMSRNALEYDMAQSQWWQALLGAAVGVGSTVATGGLNNLLGLGGKTA